MAERLLIVGQGLAGTLLAWECERAGLAFEIADAGHERAASRVGAGMITPVTGRRWVKTWRVDAWREPALGVYREIERALGQPLVRDMRVWRTFRDAEDRAALAIRVARGELAPYVSEVGAQGCWIEGAVHVDTATLIERARERWRAAGVLSERRMDLTAVRAERLRVVVCGGVETLEAFAFVPWERAWGEILDLTTSGLDPDVILNAGHWALPGGGDRARVGATYARLSLGNESSHAVEARAELERAATTLLPSPFIVEGQQGGWRTTTPDRRPCIGWHPAQPGLGLLGGLGSKGTLWAPALARAWREQLQAGVSFEPEVDVRRFWRTQG